MTPYQQFVASLIQTLKEYDEAKTKEGQVATVKGMIEDLQKDLDKEIV